MADFHFLRPLWLLLLLLIPLLPVLQRHSAGSESGWRRVIPANLLRPLLGEANGRPTGIRSRLLPASLLTLALSVALAGPAWREAPTPVQQQNDSLVIVLDLSLSMLATDVTPDRLTLAKRKIRDILAEREASLTGLVVYSADAHVVAPLTDDRRTIEGMLDVLDPTIMPAAGNRADLAIGEALTILKNGARGEGRILLISDDVSARYREIIERQMDDSPYPLNTLVVGTEDGGPIPISGYGFLRDGSEIVMAKADPESLQELAAHTGGNSHRLTLDDQDIQSLKLRSEDGSSWQDSDQDLSVKRWQDDGYWLLWLVVPLLALCWRQGALLAVLLVTVPLMTPTQAQAMEWDDLWSRPDQRGEELIRQDPAKAVERFDDPQWRGSALYRSGDYDAAARAFAQSDQTEARYNRANALARGGKLQEALDEYDTVLAQDPDHQDAQTNRDMVQQLLDQQESQQQDQNNGEQQSQQDQQGDGSNDSSQNSDGSNPPQDPSEGNGDGDDSQQPESGSPQDQDGNQQSQGNPEESEQGQSDPLDDTDSTGEQAQDDETGADQQAQADPLSELNTSSLSQGQEQWLRRVPDDPGGLLRRKFLQQFQNRETQPDKSDTPW